MFSYDNDDDDDGDDDDVDDDDKKRRNVYTNMKELYLIFQTKESSDSIRVFKFLS